MNPQRKGRLMLLVLVVVFALPVAIAVWMYASGWRPSAGGSYGELLTPPRALEFSVLPTPGGRAVDATAWKDKWHLVYVSAPDCNLACSDALQEMRRIHASLAKEIGRLERVWLLNGAPSTQVAAIQVQYPDLLILANAAPLARQMEAGAAHPGGLYLVDPLGNLVMRYVPGSDPAGIRKDLLRLLKHSWAG